MVHIFYDYYLFVRSILVRILLLYPRSIIIDGAVLFCFHLSRIISRGLLSHSSTRMFYGCTFFQTLLRVGVDVSQHAQLSRVVELNEPSRFQFHPLFGLDLFNRCPRAVSQFHASVLHLHVKAFVAFVQLIVHRVDVKSQLGKLSVLVPVRVLFRFGNGDLQARVRQTVVSLRRGCHHALRGFCRCVVLVERE